MGGNRIHYLNGLRGLLALAVFLHHFFYAFFPDLIVGGSYEQFLSGKWNLSRVIAYSPLNLLFHPGMAINFFFLLSGYVQSYHYFGQEDIRFLQRSFLKRYFRLAIPILVVVMLVFIFHRLQFIRLHNFPYSPVSDAWIKTMLPDNMSFWQAVNYAVNTCFNGAHDYYSVLWTMPTELYNSWMVVILLLVTHQLKNKAPLIILWIFAQVFLLKSYYAVSFSVGLLICMLHQRSPKFNLIVARPFVKVICLILGLYLASFPHTGYETFNQKSIYKPIDFFENSVPHVISYIIGNTLLFLFILHAPRIKKILSGRVFQFYGDISFMLYLIHFLILFSFSPWLYQRLASSVVNTANLWLTALISFAFVTGVSYLLYKLVDQPVIKLCNAGVKRIFGI